MQLRRLGPSRLGKWLPQVPTPSPAAAQPLTRPDSSLSLTLVGKPPNQETATGGQQQTAGYCIFVGALLWACIALRVLRTALSPPLFLRRSHRHFPPLGLRLPDDDESVLPSFQWPCGRNEMAEWSPPNPVISSTNAATPSIRETGWSISNPSVCRRLRPS